MTLVASLLGATFVGGLLIVLSAFRVDSRSSAPSLAPTRIRQDMRRRAALAAGLGGTGLIVTRWPVAAVALAGLGWFSAELFGSSHSRELATARTEAIASWTEMLRDTMSGAHGLEETIITTAAVAPGPIKPEVTALAIRLERHPLTDALDQLATDLAHPTGDLVVASLRLSSQGAVGDLGELLGTLAIAARDEAAMRLRVEATRARLRTAVRVIAGCTAATAIGLVVLNRPYLEVYSTPVGQLVLALVAIAWSAALWWLARMGEFLTPGRFLATGPDRVVS
jgi:hypothetical protein